MKTICRTGYVTIPEGITITIKAKVVTVKGPRGTLVKDLKHIPIDMQLIEDGKKIKIAGGSSRGRRRRRSALRARTSRTASRG